jgi:hypothetical protein
MAGIAVESCKIKASSCKLQATSHKIKAASHKLQAARADPGLLISVEEETTNYTDYTNVRVEEVKGIATDSQILRKAQGTGPGKPDGASCAPFSRTQIHRF